jgi:hypothetical protein
MSKMGELYLEKCIDFERLHETSMQWDSETWGKQLEQGRFIQSGSAPDFKHRYIYWFENYVSLMAARNVLEVMGETYAELYDSATEQWCMTSTYQDLAWL